MENFHRRILVNNPFEEKSYGYVQDLSLGGYFPENQIKELKRKITPKQQDKENLKRAS